MAEKINELKEEEKAKLNAAFAADQDALKAKPEQASGDKGEQCAPGINIWMMVLLILLLVSFMGGINWGFSWWIIPLIFFVVCKSRC